MKTYIFGHKKPDTDSVMSAIALSYLKNYLHEDTEPRILGMVNKETKFALKYFNLAEPKYLNDVKLQLKDISYHKGFFIKDTDSIFNGYQYMLKKDLTGIPVTKENGLFAGLITIKDLSHNLIDNNVEDLYTSYSNLLDVLKGTEILHFSDEIVGKLLVASYRSTTFMSNVKLEKNMILIVGDRHSVIEYAINSKVKLIILTNNCTLKEQHLNLAKDNRVNIIRTPYDTYHVARLMALTNYIKTMVRNYNPIKFEISEFVDTVIDVNNKLKHTNYPIVDKKNNCLGLLKITDLSEKSPKKVILVDHNEKLQSVEGLEEADIIEIIDHHNLGSITTTNPINFKNMAVGSTCTIVYTMFQEKNVPIPKSIAGALLSGILSDTMILKSPTTTQIDINAVKNLATLAGVDYNEYGMKLLKAGTSLTGMSKEDVLYNDYKLYTVNDKTFAVSQFFTMNFQEIEQELDQYIHVLDEVAEVNNHTLVALYVTDIIKNGSYIIYNTKAKDIVDVAYEQDIEEGHFIPGCISRKKHIVPVLMEIIEN